MKKFYILIVFLTAFLGAQAQTPLTTAVDFTVTDVHGNTHNLFNILNSGKYVVIDFFYTTCGPCQQTAPEVNASYIEFGCNEGDVIFLGIDNGDNNSQVISFENTYGATYPSASGTEGGGDAVCSAYGITAYPTVILIAPNKQIVEQDIWPCNQSILHTKLTAVGLSPMACSSGFEDYLAQKAVSRIMETYPNPSTGNANLSVNIGEESNFSIQVMNLIGEVVYSMPYTYYKEGEYTIPLNLSALANGTYVINLRTEEKLLDTGKIVIMK